MVSHDSYLWVLDNNLRRSIGRRVRGILTMWRKSILIMIELIQRKFARLLGLGHRDDWTGVCESTPALIDGEDYDGPSYCEDKVSRWVAYLGRDDLYVFAF